MQVLEKRWARSLLDEIDKKEVEEDEVLRLLFLLQHAAKRKTREWSCVQLSHFS